MPFSTTLTYISLNITVVRKKTAMNVRKIKRVQSRMLSGEGSSENYLFSVRVCMVYDTFSEHRNSFVFIWLWPIVGVNEPDEMV